MSDNEESQTEGDPNPIEEIARTSGSSDMRRFINEVLADGAWSRAAPLPDGLGLPRLQRLSAFTYTIQALDQTQRSRFGPSKALVKTLFLRLFGEHITGSKAVMYEALRQRLDAVLATWPPATAQSGDPPAPTSAPPPAATSGSALPPAPAPAPAVTLSNFWDQFARPPSPPPPVFKSVLADETSLTPIDFASGLFSEMAFFLPPGTHRDAMTSSRFLAIVPALKSFFEAITGHPLPASLDDTALRARIFHFLSFPLSIERHVQKRAYRREP